MNSILLFGRATASIELKQTQAGKTVATFSLAVKRPFTKDTTDFFNVTVWDKLAETMSKYVKKGDQVCIRGYLQNRSWEDNNGNKRTATEIVAQECDFVASKTDSQGTEAYTPTNYIPDAYNVAPKGDFETIDESEDGLPF